jgi:hypothetical protein
LTDLEIESIRVKVDEEKFTVFVTDEKTLNLIRFENELKIKERNKV